MDLEISIQHRLVCTIYAGVYLSAFASNYVQIAGLWGTDGILPAEKLIDRTPLAAFLPYIQILISYFPSLSSHSHTDTLLYCLSGLGILISLSATLFKSCNNSLSFFIMWALYYYFYNIGDTFLSFQWDILLIESGFLMIFYARMPFQQKPGHTQICAREMIKWLLFRYIFSSGNVKLLSKCPTWWDLSALYYHYETQCLPTPISWFFHQLPKFFQRFSVAMTYYILILTPPLFFVPIRSCRIYAGLMQIFMQVLIIITGNYNFFNIMTIGL
jgi:hypothetical protein